MRPGTVSPPTGARTSDLIGDRFGNPSISLCIGTRSPWTYRPHELSHHGVESKSEKAVKLSFGDRLRSLRQSAGLSQEELASRAQLDRSYIGGVERGERNVSLVNIHKIARALKVKPEALFQ